jgi:hypothetical protein
VKQGAPLIFTLFWQSTAALKDEPLTLQLSQPKTTAPLTTTSPVQGTYPFGQWSPNEVVADRYRLRTPTDVEPGRYTLEVIVGRGEPIKLGTLELYKGNRVVDEPPVAQRIESMLGDAIELVGYNLDRTAGTIRLDLIWRARQPIEHDYTVFTHALDGAGRLIGGQDNQPAKGAYPTSWWIPGEYISDTYTLPPAEAIDVGLYDPETGARLGSTIRLR